MSADHKSFWTTIPGMLTGVASMITAIVGLFTFMNSGKAPAAPKAPAAITIPFAQPERPVGCGKVVGNWTWFIGGVVTFAPDGRLSWFQNPSNLIPTALGSWSCTDADKNTVALAWPNGFVDTVTLSADGKMLSGTNHTGIQIWGKRQ
jgi:hypothetical protein